MDLPAGVVELAAGEGPLGEGSSPVLVRGGPIGPDGLRSIDVEVLTVPVAELLRTEPLTEDALDAFASRHEADRSDVDELVAGLVADGSLIAPGAT